MSFAEEFMATLSDMAEALGLEDDERESFVNSGMERKGFKKTFTWADPDKEDNDSGGDFFSAKKREKQTRQVGSQRRGDGKGANWQYGG